MVNRRNERKCVGKSAVQRYLGLWERWADKQHCILNLEFRCWFEAHRSHSKIKLKLKSDVTRWFSKLFLIILSKLFFQCLFSNLLLMLIFKVVSNAKWFSKLFSMLIFKVVFMLIFKVVSNACYIFLRNRKRKRNENFCSWFLFMLF